MADHDRPFQHLCYIFNLVRGHSFPNIGFSFDYDGHRYLARYLMLVPHLSYPHKGAVKLATYSRWWPCDGGTEHPTDWDRFHSSNWPNYDLESAENNEEYCRKYLEWWREIEYVEFCLSGILLTTVFFTFNFKVPSSSGKRISFASVGEENQYICDWNSHWQTCRTDWLQYNMGCERCYSCPSCGKEIYTSSWEAVDPKFTALVESFSKQRNIKIYSGDDYGIDFENSVIPDFDAYRSLAMWEAE